MPHGMPLARPYWICRLIDQIAGLVQDAALRLLHDQRRHQIFEHRARPRHQRAAEADLDDRPAKPEPVLGRQIALGDGEQAGQPCFGCQKVVAAFVELVLLDAVADRQQLALRAEEEGEIHLEGELARRARRSRPAACAAPRRSASSHVRVVRHAPRRCFQARRPFGQRPGSSAELRLVRRMAMASLRISRASTVRLMVRIEAISGCVFDACRRRGACRRCGRAGAGAAAAAGRAVVRQVVKALLEASATQSSNAVEIALQMRRRRFCPIAAGRGDRDQMAGEIAAVDGSRHRAAAAASACLVSYQLNRWPRKLLASSRWWPSSASMRLDGVRKADPAEIARRNDRQQIDADIGRRGARRHNRMRRFLEIVRRQQVVLGRHEGLEIAPGAARDGAQSVARSVGGTRSRSSVSADRLISQANGRRDDPEARRREGRRRCPSMPARAGDGQADDGDDHGAVHHAGNRPQRRLARRLVRLRGGAPFQQVAGG